MNLDPDDEFNGTDNLQYLYNKIKSYNADIISFSYILKRHMIIKNLCGKFNTKIIQPELFETIYKYKNETQVDIIIVNKLIKREIF